MASSSGLVRAELGICNRAYAGRLRLRHVFSRGGGSVVVYPPSECGRFHGNFLDDSYAAILARPEWRRRLEKVHAQGRRSLPGPEPPAGRKWRELDSSTSSDALLMNIFCYPGLMTHAPVGQLLGMAEDAQMDFGFKARVPRVGTTGDATEIDLRIMGGGSCLLVEAKLTESHFQQRELAAVEKYRDFETVFDRDLLPRSRARFKMVHDHDLGEIQVTVPGAKYESYQMIRNILAAYALDARLCILLHEARIDLREQYHEVLRAVRPAELRPRCTLLTWQELAAACPQPVQEYLAEKYGIEAR